MILGEITLMSPIAEQVMVMASQVCPSDYVNEINRLRELLTGYKMVGPKNRIQPHKSYIKIIKNNQDKTIIIRGPQYLGQYKYVYLFPFQSSFSLRLLSAWNSPIGNTTDTRAFFNIYEIPNELYYELQTLTEQWLKQSTIN